MGEWLIFGGVLWVLSGLFGMVSLYVDDVVLGRSRWTNGFFVTVLFFMVLLGPITGPVGVIVFITMLAQCYIKPWLDKDFWGNLKEK